MEQKDISDWIAKFQGSAAQISIVVITLGLYVITKHPIFGILIALELVAFVVLEFKEGEKIRGKKGEIEDTVKSFGIALLIWFSLCAVLGTLVPISAIVTCSMLPNVQRGDLVIVHGGGLEGPLEIIEGIASGNLKLVRDLSPESVDAAQIEMSRDEFGAVESAITQVKSPYGNITVRGSMYAYCVGSHYTNPLCREFLNNSGAFVDSRGALEFHYSSCEREYVGMGVMNLEPCISKVVYKGQEYPMKVSNSIIVYEPNKGDYFSYIGDIIHRVQLKVKVEDDVYPLTKGDNNNVFDIQTYDASVNMWNRPVKMSRVKGVYVFSVPYIGYFKLFLFGHFEEEGSCSTNLITPA
ncbi:hypothetical protein KJ780_02670 [Candidatus Micrarchaeota archaeon]|nr:hypothetical protein [Candidatus Micrarchaeota archaeon]